MNAMDILVPLPLGSDNRSERQRALWAATHERIERFLPGFLDEVIPPPPPSGGQPNEEPASSSTPDGAES